MEQRDPEQIPSPLAPIPGPDDASDADAEAASDPSGEPGPGPSAGPKDAAPSGASAQRPETGSRAGRSGRPDRADADGPARVETQNGRPQLTAVDDPRVTSGYEGGAPSLANQITVDRVVRFVLAATGVGVAAWLLWYFAGLVMYLAVGGLLAYILKPVVDRVQGFGFGRIPAILATFVGVFGVIALLLSYIAPFVAQQVDELSRLISVEVATDVAGYIETRLQRFVDIKPGTIEENVRRAGQALMQGELLQGGSQQVTEAISSVVSIFTNIVYAAVIIPFITFFFLKDGTKIRRSVLGLVPNRYFEITLAILDKVEANIGRYFRALMIQCVSIAIIASVLLYVVGLENAVPIGIFTGLANSIPYFGPFLGFLAGSLVGIAQTGDFSLILGVAVAMGGTQLADNVLLQPLIFSRAAKAHPLVILFVVLIGARLAGIVGMLVAIPLTTTIRVVAEQVWWSLQNYRILRTGT